MMFSTVLAAILRDAAKPPLLRMTVEIASQALRDDVEHVAWVADPGIHVFAELKQGSHNDFFACVCVGSGDRHIRQQIRTVRERTG
jgi:hypothetical protein